MALRINLYHEILLTKKQAKYDPLKISIFCGILIAIGLVSWFFIVLNVKSGQVAAYQAKEAEYKALQSRETVAATEEVDHTGKLAMMDKLQKRLEDRFYWAPLLEDVTTCAPSNIQVTRVVGDVMGEGLRKCTITLEGIAAGDEPRGAAEDFRTALVERIGKRFKNPTVTFKTLDDSIDQAVLDGRTLKTATFSISVIFTSGTEPPPAPVIRSKRGAKTVAQETAP